ncbi:hypothetical protein TWF569_003198 [Orbilia oligospora]|uniref:Ubiquitin 3 binding protein But2 C-terminal domain-containing protein n=1 Tax=Orbilia oligospora TaxID=2813651 RepID=A0A7C8JKG8_ORBOL|nr:hypothetical protein TWF706_010453 [Orbilia oligospora]KAF3098915.1 hypothetical protein TWF102_005958 [Orbilia oligospora]KAF3108182.1 hypothetical protein TWF103_005730 [Orbilia oligospora]KAF3124549.1 hypothetical protein TWF703_011302 [Orbilia oligospora]KAF3133321.1 hypothetical protein TWF594_009267 [Orbilia oligospora]
MQLQLASLALFALGAIAAPTVAPSQGFVPTIGPFALKVNTANQEMNNKFLVPTAASGNSTDVVLAFSDLPDRSFYLVPNSHNPVPPGPYLAQGTILYEVKFHTRAYNLTLDLTPWNGTETLYTPVILRDEYDVGTPYAHSAAFSKPGVAFLNDTSEFLGCRGDVPTDNTYTLNWQTNFAPGNQGRIDYKCSPVIISIADH